MDGKFKVRAKARAVIRTKEGLIRAICADGVTRCLTDAQYAVEETKKRRKKRNLR